MLIPAIESLCLASFDMGPASLLAGQPWGPSLYLVVKVETTHGMVGWPRPSGTPQIRRPKAGPLDTIVDTAVCRT